MLDYIINFLKVKKMNLIKNIKNMDNVIIEVVNLMN